MSKETIEAIYPLSPMQEGMLFHTLYAPTSGVYFEQLSCTLAGALDDALFRQAWQHVVDRHAALRTLFVWENRDKSLQVVRQRAALPWTHHDWRGIASAEQEQRLASFLAEDRAQGFDLRQAPLMRCAIIQRDDALHQFVWSFHHLLLDGWSVSQVLQEAFAVYEALCHQQPVRLEPTRPYRDYIIWLQKQDTAKGETFWRQTLAGFDAPTPLGGRPISGREIHPTDQERDHARFRVRLDLKTTTALQAFAKQYRLTLNTLTQGAWAILLSRYAGMQDVLFGVTVSGRPAEIAGIETMVGLFINTLPLRVHIPAQGTLLAWLQALQTHQADTRQYEYCSLINIQKWSDVPPNLPLFESILVFENYPTGTILQSTSIPLEDANRWYKADGLEIRNIRFFERTNYPLTIAVEPDAELVLEFDYNPAHFDADTLHRIAGHLQTLLEAMPTHLEHPPAALPMLTAAERQQILVEWNATQVEFPERQCLHQLFEAQVERTPDAVAVVFEQQTLTYRELNARANQLAHYLQKLGVGPESLVAICLERSLEMVVGILGVLKAGGAYVPLDPTYPQERLSFMLEDAKSPVLLTQQTSNNTFDITKTSVVYLDKWEPIKGESAHNPASGCTSENLAYVIYTSGSTGKPKGAMISHRAICNHMHWMQATFPLDGNDAVFQKTPVSFDASVWEFYAPLLAGARLVMARPDGHRDADYLIATIKENQVTTLQLVPTLLKLLLQNDEFQTCTSLKRVFCGGEALPHDLIEHFYARLSAKLYNLYGPTEATIDSTFWICHQDRERQIVPIGHPVANMETYILDAYLQPVPVGIAGELHLGGAGLGRGYLHRPGLTAERFIPNPFSEEPGTRLYKTGDLTRYLPNGDIEFLGRSDHQVKVRGLRIELDEIETVLSQHPAVREAVVTVISQIAAENQRLVAYFVATEDATPLPDELRTFLKQKLPDYMIPAALIQLPALPLTPNGKIDRRALPEPETWQTQPSETYIAPRTPLEAQLAGIWAEVLGIEQVGVHDDFFALGGHSLQTMQLVSKIAATTQHHLPIRTIFRHPTVAALAQALSQAMADAATDTQQPDAGAPPKQDYAVTHPPTTAGSSFLKIERRSLLTHFALGKLAPVDAAALVYLDNNNMEHQALLKAWFNDMPLFADVLETTLGRIALIYFPILETELYTAKARLTQAIMDSLKMAQHLEARAVSLPGLIPSATEYGLTIHRAATEQPGLPAVSTGQATITAAVIMMIEKILEQGGRALNEEHVGMLGLSAVSATALRVILQNHPHPKTIILCDPYNKLDELQKFNHELVTDLAFRGTVRIASAQGQAPTELYEATLIVGATNVPEALDITRVHPGTLIVDDSAPRCFNRERAIERFKKHADILFTEGDILKSSHPIRQTSFIPRGLETILPRYNRDPFTITGCVLSGLLSARFKHLKPTLGLVQMQDSRQHYQTLLELGFAAADLHCDTYTLAPTTIRRFREQLGNNTKGDRL